MSSNQYFDSARPKEEPRKEEKGKIKGNGMGKEIKWIPAVSVLFLDALFSFPHSHSLFFLTPHISVIQSTISALLLPLLFSPLGRSDDENSRRRLAHPKDSPLVRTTKLPAYTAFSRKVHFLI